MDNRTVLNDKNLEQANGGMVAGLEEISGGELENMILRSGNNTVLADKAHLIEGYKPDILPEGFNDLCD